MEHPASLQWTLDAITTAPAIVGNDRLNFLAANQLGRAMYSDLLLEPSAPPNFARHIFLDSSAEASTRTVTSPGSEASGSGAPAEDGPDAETMLDAGTAFSAWWSVAAAVCIT